MSRELINPLTGERFMVSLGARDTGGRLLEVRASLPPGWRERWRHHHPTQDERIEVLAGELTAELEGRSRTYRGGESLIVPRGLPHHLSSTGQNAVLLLWQFRPALDTEQLLAVLSRPPTWSRTTPAEGSKVLVAAILARDFASEIRLAPSPSWLRPPLTSLLARGGRRLMDRKAGKRRRGSR